MKNSIATLGKVMNKVEQKSVVGGVSRAEYCNTLQDLIFGGGYQGDRAWALKVNDKECTQHGY